MMTDAKKTIHSEEKLNMLIEFGKHLSAQNNLDDLLSLIATQITNIIGARRCFIFLKDNKQQELWSKIASGKGLKYIEAHLPLNGHSIAAKVCSTGKSINIPDTDAVDGFSRDLDSLLGVKTKAILAVPLKNKDGEVIGVFQLSNKKNNTPFDKKDEGLLTLLASLASGNIEIAALYEEVRLSNLETIYRLAITAEYRDQHDTKIHLENISRVCEMLAKQLGLSQKETDTIKNASLLHDIGKVAIPDHILLKPGKLTTEEFTIMKEHAAYGGKILADAKSKILQTACIMSMHHHEKFNGKGYPAGLKGDEIPLEARILAVADVFDALCMRRVYKQSWGPDKSYQFIVENAGIDFDPEVVEAFKKTYPEIKKLYAAL